MKPEPVRSRQNSGEEGTRHELQRANCPAIDGDEVWKFLGSCGKYQIIQLLLSCLFLLPMSTAILSGVFVGKNVSPTCHSAESSNASLLSNDTVIIVSECYSQAATNSSNGTYTSFSEKRACTRFTYENEVHVSFISQWDLVCENEALGQLPQMLTMAGMMVGAATLPHLGDRFGRKILVVISHLLMFAVSVGLAFVPVFELFLLLKFLSGSFNQGYMLPTFTMIVELFTTEQRTLMGCIFNSLWVVSILCLTAIAYLLRNHSWQTLQLAYALMSSSCFLYIFTDESLRWLLTNKKVRRAKAVLKKACRLNGKKYEELIETVLAETNRSPKNATSPPEEHLLQSPPIDEKHVVHKQQKLNPSLLDVMKNPTLRKISLTLCYAWMVCSFTYYGITLLSTSLAGDPYINFLLGGVLELPANLMLLIVMKRYGRKASAVSFTSLAGVSLLAAVFVATLAAKTHATSLVQTALTLLGKFFIVAAFNTIWVWTPELYPTNIRNVGMGISATCARIAAIASPFLTILARKALWAPGALFSAACVLSVFLLTFLPETGWRELPQSIEEVEGWFNSDRARTSKWRRHGNTVERENENSDQRGTFNRIV